MNAPLIHSMPIVTAYSFNILLDFLRRIISLEIDIVILVEIPIYFITEMTCITRYVVSFRILSFILHNVHKY